MSTLMVIHLKIIGTILICLSLLHIGFPRYFNWRKELHSLSLINQQMMQVHTFFIGLTLFLMGLLCLTSATDLLETTVGKKVSLGFGLFWVFRLVIQFFGYSVKLWKGKVFETAMHIIFSLIWAYFSIVFISIYLNR
jgi:hypothetical protein